MTMELSETAKNIIANLSNQFYLWFEGRYLVISLLLRITEPLLFIHS